MFFQMNINFNTLISFAKSAVNNSESISLFIIKICDQFEVRSQSAVAVMPNMLPVFPTLLDVPYSDIAGLLKSDI